jgi:hypothetical protein
MKMAGFFLMLMALVVGIVPLLTDCQAQGHMMTLVNGNSVPMKCHWTALGEIAMAVPLLAVGGLMAFNRHRETLRALSVIGAVLGIFIVMLPTQLIGVCPNPDMLCNVVMRPTLVFAGSLVTAASVVAFMIVRREEMQPVRVEVR